ncbi:inositol-3-phosphate synthase [Myxococcus sp. AM001]|uniref:inositol-3-phosphate synthase n=1 Tax=Myxococcus TaxID=32 RepID=UPI0013D0EDF5|nr:MULTISPECIES: inositol-3-phosphate synthase [Myxococcus]NVI99316.1 inositol-3-phosphate synthase [Myxococcus sp. AM009]NVJ05352.1 inositol-3-phosphate synthase [Myxococcus sp. AM001]NVJ17431.1 inositol-3-phosphate synthase [Myxococcus sp. AM010]
MENKRSVAKPDGKLAVLIPGLGAVSTTLMAGVELARQGKGHPIGSLTQMGTARLGKRTDGRTVKLNELVPLAELKDIAFGAWDIIREDAYEVAVRSGVLSDKHLEEVKPFLQGIKPKQGVHDAEFVRRIEANHIKATKTHRESIEALRQDIRDFKKELNATRAVMVVCSSVETFRPLPESFKTLAAFEKALDENSPDINPTALYTYAAIKEGVPFANATPNASVDTPALQELAKQEAVAVAGRDLKSGQTMMKTVIAPALKARMLGLDGWFSTNILGNRDGEVLDDPAAFKAKEVTKSSVLDTILQPDLYPELYKKYAHKVSIHYYPPRGDAKEGWDNIDITGWLGYPMQIKVNFLCRDSILAAPLVLDIALFLDLAKRLEWRGIQEWMSFYFKSPMAQPGLPVEHDLFIQLTKLKNTLRVVAGEDPITHLGLDYYGDDLPLSK